MEDNKCERCGKAKHGMIILTHSDNEQETICTDCFNKEMADYYDIEDFKDYIKSYTAIDLGLPWYMGRYMQLGYAWKLPDNTQGKSF